MHSNNGITLDLTDSAIKFISAEGYDPQFGARPVKRAIQKLVLNDLSKQIIAGKVNNQKPIKIDVKEDVLSFEN